MMAALPTLLLSGLGLAALGFIWRSAARDHHAALTQRRALLDHAAGLFRDSHVTFGPDGFPALTAKTRTGLALRLELIADTLVCRRLPQLWLKLTLFESHEHKAISIGALARPTGAEYYSAVHAMACWLPPPPGNVPMLMRGDTHATPEQVRDAGAAFSRLFTDPTIKETTITPRGTGLVIQACQGKDSAHILLRQAQFPIDVIETRLIEKAVAGAETLRECLAQWQHSDCARSA